VGVVGRGVVLWTSQQCCRAERRHDKYREDATGINDWKEVEVNTGLKHGFLFRPVKEWTEPTTAWARR